ncbi:hypothetical protein [Phytopseudomonas daroniae]|uniref:hypothetical protein n=1 Tax=Phytopseudomonas daroniae TaxID=2487519 RepID=UPI001038540D|nr:hypothetical protein [Pseudomonas daroniae]TBU71252.1 hypothetical protein DNK10_24845 [Pseudomonas daroniae]
MNIEKHRISGAGTSLPEKSQVLVVIALEAELAEGITLTREEVHHFNHARDIYDELRRALFDAVMPAIGGSHHPVSVRLYDLLQEFHLHSGGMVARHRQAMERMDQEREVEA